MSHTGRACKRCKERESELARANAEVEALRQTLSARDAELEQLRPIIAQYERELRANGDLDVEQATRVQELEQELRKYRRECELRNRPERVATERLQLAFEGLLEPLGIEAGAAANDDASDATDATVETADTESQESASAEQRSESPPAPAPSSPTSGDKPKPSAKPRDGAKGRHKHGRRRPEQWPLPTYEWRIEPDEVLANPDLYRKFDEEVSYRTAYHPASYVKLKVIRSKYVLVTADLEKACLEEREAGGEVAAESPVHVAPLPHNLLSHCMAEASAIAHVIVGKYDDILPLSRQERISKREQFHLPRSTQAGWLEAAYALLHRVVVAMFAEAKITSTVLGVDATGAPVQRLGGCRRAHVFALVSNAGHIIFRWVNTHSSTAISEMLAGYRGVVLGDATAIYNRLTHQGMTLAYCWAHVRRYLYKALATDERLALEGIAIIAKLFLVEREAVTIAMPERTEWRRERALPIVTLFSKWVIEHDGNPNIGAPLQRALGYYINQREGLWRFLDNGDIPIHNNACENQLRNLAMGRDVWRYFLNHTGLNWYTAFRSLIASCHMHGLNPQQYLEEVLRLVSHWPVSKVLELSPKYWAQTRINLSAPQQSLILAPWDSPLVTLVSDDTRRSEPRPTPWAA